MGTRVFFYRSAQVSMDLGVLASAYLLAYLVRFEGAIPPLMLRTLAWTLPYVVVIYYLAMMTVAVPRLAWRYIALPDMPRVAGAIGLASMELVLIRAASEAASHNHPLFTRTIIPYGVIFSASTFAFLGVIGVRVARRMLAERTESGSRDRPRAEPVPTMLIGAGRAGVLVAKELAARPDLGMRPVGFIDDEPGKLGTVVHGVPVVGGTKDLAELCFRRGAKQALITVAAAPGKDIRRITKLCEAAKVPVKIIPGIFEIVGGTVNLSRIRKVAIEDLLRRELVSLDEAAIDEVVKGRSVLVTGAGGSIGSELCRQICRFSPRALLLVEHSENNLFYIERELREMHPTLELNPLLADIRERPRMDALFRAHRPDVVFHAAAHKHVPMMEANPGEAIKNNVLGTKLVAELSDAYGVAEFVMISTDKAVNPTSVMGASKRAAEIFVQALSRRSKTRFVAVRFGNVLGSAGSVVPISQDQIARGGPVTVTDAAMKRYFMTIPEACQLVLQAGSMGKGGEIFVLDMGEPVKILDLARDLIELSGFRVGEDIEIQVTGARPGEKLFEELALEEEGAERTRHPKVYIGRIKPRAWDEVARFIDELEHATAVPDGVKIREIFGRFIPEYQPMSVRNGSAAAVAKANSMRPPAPAVVPVVPSGSVASRVAKETPSFETP
jgi:FlaA1/EpsC-like NDP-sugar epimerase